MSSCMPPSWYFRMTWNSESEIYDIWTVWALNYVSLLSLMRDETEKCRLFSDHRGL